MAKLTRETTRTDVFAEVTSRGGGVAVDIGNQLLTVKESKAVRGALRAAEHVAITYASQPDGGPF